MAKSVFLVPFVAFIFFAVTSNAEPSLPGPYPASVVSVVDGDTVNVKVKIWLGLYQEVAVRVYGIDTPESLRAHCPSEKELGLKAKNFVEKLLPVGTTITLSQVRDDKYHGRVVATVRTTNGEDLSQRLLKEGLAAPYDGGKKKSWCAPET
jgi:endonuclease YncB( thermonuclease family)